jgi:hypothetical protein
MDVLFPNPNDGKVPVRFCHELGQAGDTVVLKIYTVSSRKIYDRICLDESGDSSSQGPHCYKLDWGQAQLSLANGLYYFVIQEKGALSTKTTKRLFIKN